MKNSLQILEAFHNFEPGLNLINVITFSRKLALHHFRKTVQKPEFGAAGRQSSLSLVVMKNLTVRFSTALSCSNESLGRKRLACQARKYVLLFPCLSSH